MPRYITRVAASAVGGTIACTAALMALSARRTGSVWPGLNCTAHWFKGDMAAKVRTPDLNHTAVGFMTNVAATVFWAALYEGALDTGRRAEWNFPIVSVALGPIAAAADYRATPKRFTPGWELIFTKRDMALIYGALAIGMASGSVGIRFASGFRLLKNSRSDPSGWHET